MATATEAGPSTTIRTVDLEHARGGYGWRARIGYITPASTIETPVYELYQMAPAGVTVVSAGLNIRKITPDAVETAWERVIEVAREIAQYDVDYLIVAGGPLAYFRGAGADRVLSERVQDACGVPTVHELTATVDALRGLGVKRLAVASPFSAGVNERLRTFLEAEDFSVEAIQGLDKDSNPEITLLPLAASYQVSREVFRRAPGVDGIYITCPRWAVTPNIEPLEQDLRVPVVASVQVCLWAALRHLSLRAPIPGFGRLMREL